MCFIRKLCWKGRGKQEVDKAEERGKRKKGKDQKYQRQWKVRYRVLGAGYGICALWLIFLAGGFALSVQAAPAVLDSASAVVYEQMSEGSTPLANLIQDGQFEYLGDVTAEDGSVWHAVTTQGGTSGYIRGDISVRVREDQETEARAEAAEQNQTETPQGDQSEIPEAGAAEMPQENQASPAEEPAGAGEETAADEPDGEDGEAAEGDEPGGETEILPQQIQPVQNNQAKTYAPEAVGKKIKEQESAGKKDAAADTRVLQGEGKDFGTDWPIVLCIGVFVISGLTALFCVSKIRKIRRRKSVYTEEPVSRGTRISGKKKRKNRHRKNRKHRKQRENQKAHR